MRGSQFCYFHGRTRIYVQRPRSREPLQLPPLQDLASIHAALNEVFQALASGNLETKRAANLFRPCRWRCKPRRDCLRRPPGAD